MYKKKEFCFECDVRLPVQRTLIFMVTTSMFSDELFTDLVPTALREYADALEQEVKAHRDPANDLKPMLAKIVDRQSAKLKASNGCEVLTIAGTESLIIQTK